MKEKQQNNQPYNLDAELDWEYMSDYFVPNEDLNKEENKLKTLEEYAAESKEEMAEEEPEEKIDFELKKIMEDVKKVKEECVKGFTVKEISSKLDLSEQYITTILFTIQGYPEDNDFAVAQLVQLG